MNDDTHTITMKMGFRNPTVGTGSCSITTTGDGDKAHVLLAAQAFLVACGFDPITASRLCFDES